MDVDPAAESPCEFAKVQGVARDDEVTSCSRADHDRRVDDVRRARTSTRRASRPRPGLVEVLHPTAAQKAGKAGLRSASPRLPEDPRGNHRLDASCQRSRMQRPYLASIRLGGEERAGVVRDAAHAERRVRLLRVAASSTASAAASSSSVSDPCSASHSATAPSPSSMARARAAASFSQADTLRPRRFADVAAAAATSSSSATDSFRTATRRDGTTAVRPVQ